MDAAKLLAEQPTTLQLRYLQTLKDIGNEKNTTIIFPLPIEMLSLLGRSVGAGLAGAGPAGPVAGGPRIVTDETGAGK